ncbi:hypothetical protein Golomagni_07157 [Golovinomyces magnicellulatus]|nr:hypothetical protein Golomagni_07157 [Golovinomyces magnicellulatus]
MAPGKAYPRATIKKIIKAHSDHNIKKNADVTIFLNYVLFMETLVKEAAIHAKQSGERGLTTRSVRKVTRVSHKTHLLVDTWFLTVKGYPGEIQRLNKETKVKIQSNYTL